MAIRETSDIPGAYRVPRGIHTANVPIREQMIRPQSPSGTRSFVAIAHQIGAGSPELPYRLAETLTARSQSRVRWSAWDRELIDKVVADYRIQPELIQSVEQSQHSWLDEFFAGLYGSPDEVTVVHRVNATVSGLARQGGVILVGHGSTFMTRGVPGGLHIRLVAPRTVRVANVARWQGIDADSAARVLRRLDRQRALFLRRFWPGATVASEDFDATLNAGSLDESRLIECIVSLVMSPLSA